MQSDTFFTIGTSHRICQDYALCGPDYVILSDGCSSAADTDFGSRLLVKAAERYIDQSWEIRSIIITANDYRQSLNLPEESICATLLRLKANNDHFVVNVAGDGAIAARKKDGTIRFIVYENTSGAPYYPSYEICNKKAYFERFGASWHNIATYDITPDNHFSSKRQENLSDYKTFTEVFPFSEFDLVAIMSDGILSFLNKIETKTTKSNESVHPVPIIRKLLAFKQYAGQFVQRRCNAAFKEFQKKNWSNTDDFSIGVLYNQLPTTLNGRGL